MSRQGKREAAMSNTGRGHSRMYTDSGWETQGGYMAAKIQKLQDQHRTEIEPSGKTTNIFKGVAIYVNGYTRPSSDELKRLVLTNGGRYEHYLYKTRVTHIIATNLTNSKIKDLMKNGKVVKPEWITDSVKAGRLLSYCPYLLYTNQGGKQQGLETFSTHKITNSSTVSSVTMETDKSYLNERENSATDKYQSNEDNALLEKEKLKLDIDESRRQLDPEGEGQEEKGMSDADNDDFLFLDNGDLKEHPHQTEHTCKDDHKPGEVIPADQVAQNIGSTLITSLGGVGQTNAVNGYGTPSSKRTGIAKAGEPAFLNEFYSNSRLHHLSTWKSEWRAYVKTLQDQSQDFPGRTKLMEVASNRLQDIRGMLGNGHNLGQKQSGKPPRIIMHIDMDCFFVSVGLKKRPNLRGQPVAVTHSRGQGMKGPLPGSNPDYEQQQWTLRHNQGGKKGRKPQLITHIPMLDEGIEEGTEDDDKDTSQPAHESFHSMAEIASCSYEARQHGVRNGMFMGKAKQLCPRLLTIPYDFEGYQEVSKILYDTVARYTHDIEAVSCDEMLVDCTDLLSSTGTEPLEFASLLRQELLEQTGCPASAGMGSNILLAKMATRKAKPNGQYFLESEDVLDFLSDQPIQTIPGVGWSMSKKLKTMNVEKCGDLQKVSLGVLQREFGPKTGQSLYRYCRGKDDRPIKTEQERKSVSAEINYGIRFKHNGEAEKFLLDLSEEVHTRLKNINRKGKTVTLKVMVRREDAPVETSKFMGHGICNNLSKSVTLPFVTDDPKVISKECIEILHNMKVKASDLRGIGIQLQRLEPSTFGDHNSTKGAQSILNFTVSKQANLNDLGVETSIEDHKNIVRQKGGETEVNLPEERDTVSDDSGNDFLGGYCHNIVDELSRRKTAKRFLPPLPTLPDISGSPDVATGDIDVDTSGIQDYFPSPSQIDHSVLKELPADIRRQVEKEIISRSKKDVHRHPTSQNTPCSSKSDWIRVGVDETPGCSHWSDNSDLTVKNDYLKSAFEAADTRLSPSQIDPSVLRQLPPDIQKQVENDIKRQQASNSAKGFEPHIISTGHSTNENNSTGSIKDFKAELPRCFNWSRQRSEGHDRNNISIEPLPSLSQLDESCLNALPEELQNEIRQAYVQHENEEIPRPVLNLQQASSSSKRSPGKNRSPSKSHSPGANRKSPNFKIPRGKPRRGRPKKLEFRSRHQPKITASVSNIQHEFHATSPKDCLQGLHIVRADQPAEGIHQETPTHSDSTTKETAGFVPGGELSCQNTVNLCGAVSITEVRTLLREWLRSSPVPEEEDEGVMLTYLQDLIVDKNLEQVNLVIKFLNRHIEHLQNDLWKVTFDRIVQHTQCVVLATYGSKLKLW